MLSTDEIEDGPRNSNSQQQTIQRQQSSTSTSNHESEITLMVYDLSSYNSFLSCLGVGIFHSGVCVHGVEYSYGGHPLASSGCFVTAPYGAPPPATFREAIVCGKTQKSPREVMQLVASMGGVRLKFR